MSLKQAILMAAACLALFSCQEKRKADHETRLLLNELDGYLSAQGMYVARKMDELAIMRRQIAATRDPLARYDLEMSLADAAFSFSFDTTRTHLLRARSLAQELGDEARYHRSGITLGHLYAKAGHFMEAHNLLYDQIDTNVLSASAMTEYLMALYDFGMDLSGNSGLADQLTIPPVEPLRARLLRSLGKDSKEWRTLRRDQLTQEGRYASADSLARVMLSTTRPEEHDYAIYAFHVSEIASLQGRRTEQLYWLIRSAQSDILNAVRDYASLTMVGQIILPYDVDRSFRYLRVAQEDALQYNAKLRPWQISRFLTEVEDAYTQRLDRSRILSAVASVLLAIMVLALSISMWNLVIRSRKLTRLQKELEQNNARMARSNQVQEQYILRFLEGLAAEITTVRAEDNRFRNLLKQGKADQLLRELSVTGRSEKAREKFYEAFDNTFLALYPNFVEQFNALLVPEARYSLPAGTLNTDLRIFALILLGVDDSKQIASMLDYSLSTIYNKKVAVKNAALSDRDHFEENVKKIEK